MAKNWIGLRFGTLEVISASPGRHCQCKCDCGRITTVYRTNLITGKTNSCGCQRAQSIIRRNTTHGESRVETPEYKTWMCIHYRCRDLSNPRYGGRGIRVDERWNSYEAFLQDMGRRPSPSHSIERINNDGPYSPENCRWATRTEQARNRRSSLVLSAFGVRATVSEWAESTGIPYGTLWSRIKDYGWSHERAVSEPCR